jgi:hypothetical protein
MNKPTFREYQIVEVIAQSAEKASLRGQEGVILACTEKDDGGWYYTAYMLTEQRCWCFEEDEMASTKRLADPEDFKSTASIRVRVDPAGRGSIAE